MLVLHPHRRRRLSRLVAGTLAAAAMSTSTAHAADAPISTVAGTTAGSAGDGGPATQAQLNAPQGFARASDGRLLIADTANGAVREVSASGVITTLIGSGAVRVGTVLSGAPVAVAYEQSANTFLVLERSGHYLARVTRAPNGNSLPFISVIAGTADTAGSTGDGGPATSARLNAPTNFLTLADGSILIADTGNDRIRRVVPGGAITAWAGTGSAGFAGDGGAATDARLNAPTGLALMADGSVLIADTGNNRIRRVTAGGTISTVAGSNGSGAGGDGAPATSAQLNGPTGIARLGNDGAFLISDTGNSRLRRVTPLGTIFTIAGSTAGLAGDGGNASAAQLSGPTALLATSTGGFLVADTGNSRIRELISDGQLPGPIAGRSLRITPVSGSVRAFVAGRAGSVLLRQPDLVQLGSRTNTESGQVTIETGTASGGVRTATVSGGEFSTEQPAGPVQTIFRLSAPLNGCRPREGGPVTATAATAKKKPKKKRKRRTRKIFVQSDGGHRTNGRYADAVVQGTKWSLQDFCTSTRVTVFEGAVNVRDRVKRKTVLVPAGQRYVARKTPKK